VESLENDGQIWKVKYGDIEHIENDDGKVWASMEETYGKSNMKKTWTSMESNTC
jgi:hypothetical protein